MCKGYIKISRLLDINAVYICIQDINVLVQLVSGVIIKKPIPSGWEDLTQQVAIMVKEKELRKVLRVQNC